MTKNGVRRNALFRSILIWVFLASLAGTGCVVVKETKHDHGLHKGHYKNNKK